MITVSFAWNHPKPIFSIALSTVSSSATHSNIAHGLLRFTTTRGRIQEFALGGRPLSPPLLSSPPAILVRSRVPLNQLEGLGERCKLSQRVPMRSPGRKRIWCTQKLWESQWWQSFWVFWSACFTVVTYQSVRRPRGGGAPLSRPLNANTTTYYARTSSVYLTKKRWKLYPHGKHAQSASFECCRSVPAQVHQPRSTRVLENTLTNRTLQRIRYDMLFYVRALESRHESA